MIRTERLLLIPLNYSQVQMYHRNNMSLEKDLGLFPAERAISDRLKNALEKKILPLLADPSRNYLFYTMWTVVLRSENKMVADYCFKGEPNEKEEVEIGYGTYPDHQSKGYMTEAVGGLVDWCRQQNNIKAIIAETDPANIASIKILQKNNFIEEKRLENSLLWRFDLK